MFMDQQMAQRRSASVLRAATSATAAYLAGSSAMADLAREEGNWHPGDDPIEADRDAQSYFTRAVWDDPMAGELSLFCDPITDVYGIVGEEKLVTPPKLATGQRLIVVDPLDGSKPWSMARMGWCTAALMLCQQDTGTPVVEAAAIATASHVFTLVGDNELHFGLSSQPEDRDLLVASVAPEVEPLNPSLAGVAYKPEELCEFMKLHDELPDWRLITLGGNPVVPFIITGSLTASVRRKPASTWDSIAVLMATATDAVVGAVDGTVVSGPRFRGLFSRVLLTRANVDVIPPIVVAKSTERFIQVTDAIARSGMAVD